MRLNKIYDRNIIITSNVLAESLILESENSTIMLDVDETLLTFDVPSKELLKALQSQSPNLDIQHSDTEVSIDDINDALANYSYKQHLKLIKHPKRGYILIIFRPFLKEFLMTLTNLPKDKAKDVVMVTANEKTIRNLYQQLIYTHTGINIPVIDPMEQDLHPESIAIDDDYRLGLVKYATAFKDQAARTKYIMGNMKGDSQNVINIKAFKGDLLDNELNNILPSINDVL